MRLPPPARHGLDPAPRRLSARTLTTLCGAALPLLATSLAHAAPPPERPLTGELEPAELQALGLGQSRGDPQPVPNEAPRLRWPGDVWRQAPSSPSPIRPGTP